MMRTGAEIRAEDNQSKFIQERITSVEKNLGLICESFASYTRKTARLRDKGDEVSRNIVSYIESEKLNATTKKSLEDFASNLSGVQDYRQTQVDRLENKVVHPLSSYGLICKQTKNDLKSTFAARDKEQKQHKALEKVKDRHPSDRHQISEAQAQLQRASVNASRTVKNLEEQMDNFENKKLADVKKILSDFVNIEMLFHAKALETYTKCFNNLSLISVDDDLEAFRTYMHPPDSASRQELARRVSQTSNDSYTYGMSTGETSYVHHREPARRLPATNNNKPQVNGVDNEDDEEYETETDSEDETQQPSPRPR